MLRPRESRDVRVKTSSIETSPSATLTWASDVFGNAVATASFFQLTDRLIITSDCEVELNAAPWPIFTIAPSATSYPFLHSADEWQDLGTLTMLSYADPNRRLQRWASAFVVGPRTDTLSLLKDLSLGITGWIALPEQGRGRHAGTSSNDRSRLGNLPRFRGALCRCGAKPWFRCEISLRIPLQSWHRASGFDFVRVHPCLGGGLCAGGGLDHLRSDEPKRRRLQSNSRGSCPRYSIGRTRVR